MLLFAVLFSRICFPKGIPMKPSGGRSELSYDRPEFFKVFLPNFSSHQLEIPPAFLHHLKGSIPGKAILKDHTQKSWAVDLEELNDDAFFKNGWRAFADDHHLVYGDFLIFQYEGNCVFGIKIFGKNGCRKEVPLVADHFVRHVAVKDEPGLIQTETRNTTSSDQKVLEVKSPRRSGRSKKSAAKSDTYPLKSNITTRASSKYPHFKTNVSKWSLYTVHVSKAVTDKHNIKFSPNLVLEDEKGKQWPVKIYLVRKGNYILGAGWSDFRAGNNIKIKDKCRFELVLDRWSICKKMKVKIIQSQRLN